MHRATYPAFAPLPNLRRTVYLPHTDHFEAIQSPITCLSDLPSYKPRATRSVGIAVARFQHARSLVVFIGRCGFGVCHL